jgi:hypothetical protein
MTEQFTPLAEAVLQPIGCKDVAAMLLQGFAPCSTVLFNSALVTAM